MKNDRVATFFTFFSIGSVTYEEKMFNEDAIVLRYAIVWRFVGKTFCLTDHSSRIVIKSMILAICVVYIKAVLRVLRGMGLEPRTSHKSTRRLKEVGTLVLL